MKDKILNIASLFFAWIMDICKIDPWDDDYPPSGRDGWE